MGLPEYLSGGRIQGRSDDTAPASSVQATSWKLLYDSGDVTSSTAEYLSDTFAARDHLMIINAGDSGTSGGTMQMYFSNSSTSPATNTTDYNTGYSNFADEWNYYQGESNIKHFANGVNNVEYQPIFVVGYLNNKSGDRKMWYGDHTWGGLGSGTTRANYKVDSGQVLRVKLRKENDDMNNSSHYPHMRLVVLGCDDDESNSTQDIDGDAVNFWQELDSTAWTSGTTIDCNGSGSGFATRRFLMVEITTIGTGNTVQDITFNGNTNNYRQELITDWTHTGDEVALGGTGAGTASKIEIYDSSDSSRTTAHKAAPVKTTRLFINNFEGYDKVLIGNSIDSGSAGAGNAPRSTRIGGRWGDLTGTDVIKRITVTNTGGDGSNTYATGSIVKVYGSKF